MFGKNVKVHFAGADGEENFYAALNTADARYRLYTCYGYIAKKTPDSDFRLPDNHVIKDQILTSKHTIQDSGLFTLMFGAGKEKKQTLQTLTDWQDKLIGFVKQNNIYPTVVEIDCQKVLGVEQAWFFRNRMRDLLPDRKQINVFHFEDGRKGLDRLIEFTDYIALSVPEWRIVKGKTHRDDILHVASYIKNKKPEINIHLLGCTDVKILEQLNFCTSADSTSWLAGVKYGFVNDGFSKQHVSKFNKQLFEERKQAILSELKKRDVALTPKLATYTTRASLCASILKKQYERAAGPQD